MSATETVAGKTLNNFITVIVILCAAVAGWSLRSPNAPRNTIDEATTPNHWVKVSVSVASR